MTSYSINSDATGAPEVAFSVGQQEDRAKGQEVSVRVNNHLHFNDLFCHCCPAPLLFRRHGSA